MRCLNNFKKMIFAVGLMASFCIMTQAQAEAGLESLKTLPIQDGGRVKPFHTFATESLSLIYGKETFDGKSAVEIVMTWLLNPQIWQDKEFVEIRHELVRKALALDEKKRYFSINQILNSNHFSLVMQELQSQREVGAKLNPYFQGLQRLESQMGLFQSIAIGEAMRLVPPAPTFGTEDNVNLQSNAWLSLGKWSQDQDQAFAQLARAFVTSISEKLNGTAEAKMRTALALKEKTEIFKLLAKKNRPELYPSEEKISAEIFYKDFHPFQKSWIFYLASAMMIILFWIFKVHKFYWLAWCSAFAGVLLHLLGFILRVYLTGRAPVSNMYESVVWVSFGTIVFSLGIEYFYRWRYVLFSGTIVSAACLILADSAPVILDPSLQPLQAVLNSNFWLTTHVLTITISYAAFFLALALGDVGLFFYIRFNDDHNPKIKAITLAIYRSMQVGVGFLAPGIILGGVWADYSWGRFWGWDPKETWALIVLLGYIAILHGRIAGMIKSFGLVVSAVVTFALVIMAWYGVNYILGAGLHSYGFGAGGVEYVAAFVGFQLLFVIFASVFRFMRYQK